MLIKLINFFKFSLIDLGFYRYHIGQPKPLNLLGFYFNNNVNPILTAVCISENHLVFCWLLLIGSILNNVYSYLLLLLLLSR